ncbi:MAG: hypothetical protein KKD99_04325 [Proteobacteria bacterium]|nr:hypothetical protein [Pseudomonadota bacterium]MBU4357275.1 hypothetical protein [Pseudomonadota bacterium]MBU4447794.1 hypothetical protein [Pseudomonadota bacterium]MCG2771635.1 hypothetical protein [Desulfobacterales bacterium]
MATIRDMRKTMVIGTPIAFGYRGEDTTSPLRSSIPDSVEFSKTNLYTECLQLRAENAKLKAENEGLRAKVVAMQATNSAEKFLEIREIAREQAKEEVRAFFKEHHGEAIFPSDVMEALSLDYDLVYEICEELEREGAVKGL